MSQENLRHNPNITDRQAREFAAALEKSFAEGLGEKPQSSTLDTVRHLAPALIVGLGAASLAAPASADQLIPPHDATHDCYVVIKVHESWWKATPSSATNSDRSPKYTNEPLIAAAAGREIRVNAGGAEVVGYTDADGNFVDPKGRDPRTGTAQHVAALHVKSDRTKNGGKAVFVEVKDVDANQSTSDIVGCDKERQFELKVEEGNFKNIKPGKVQDPIQGKETPLAVVRDGRPTQTVTPRTATPVPSPTATPAPSAAPGTREVPSPLSWQEQVNPFEGTGRYPWYTLGEGLLLGALVGGVATGVVYRLRDNHDHIDMDTAITQRDEAFELADEALINIEQAHTDQSTAETERNAAITQRDDAFELADEALTNIEQAHIDQATAEAGRDTAITQRDIAFELADEALTNLEQAHTDQATAEANLITVEGERDTAITERNTAVTERDAVQDERDAIVDQVNFQVGRLNGQIAVLDGEIAHGRPRLGPVTSATNIIRDVSDNLSGII